MLDDKAQLIYNLKQIAKLMEKTAPLIDKLHPERNKGQELRGAARIAKEWIKEINAES